MHSYRPEIDGLRALAILPVVLFHARVAGFTGGFIGVDVFFVISGFLITSLVANDLEQGRFSLLRFWERRARRILPALLTVAVFTMVAGWFVLLPADFARLGGSVLALTTFSSNVFFWQQSGYFGPTADELPLLHTWSLAVEEQFYLLFPITMVVITKFMPKWRTQLVLLFGVSSLLLSVWAVEHMPAAAFYLLPTRAWELALGAWLALRASGRPAHEGIRQVVSVIGVACIAVPVFAYDSGTVFPALNALAPVVGAGLVIWSNGTTRTVVGRLLAAKPLVYVGLISYPLYLWHWPLLAFARYPNASPSLSPSVIIGVIVASFVLAHLSWRFVEAPFRIRAWLPKQASMLAGAAAALVIVGISATVLGVKHFEGSKSVDV